MDMPNDPIMLLSFVNTKLRDEFDSLSGLAKYYGKSEKSITAKLSKINCSYDEKANRFR